MGEDAVAPPPSRDVARQLGDDAGPFHAGNERQRRLVLVLAEDGESVGEIDAAGMEADPRRTRAERRRRKVFEAKMLGRAEFAAQDGKGHGALDSGWGKRGETR